MPVDDHMPGDEEIIRRILEGEVDLYGLLLDRYRDYVFGIVMNHVPEYDVEEIAHDVFVRAYRSLPACRSTDKFRRWLSKIAVRTCCDYWRKRYRSREQPISALGDGQRSMLEQFQTGMDHASRDDEASSHEAREILEWAMDRLSPEDRVVLELIHIEELPVREAADMLGWSTAKVKVRAFRSRKKLRKILESTLADRGGTR
jgi:RNA polymerase sigma-70 factor (ECF subfamily)